MPRELLLQAAAIALGTVAATLILRMIEARRSA